MNGKIGSIVFAVILGVVCAAADNSTKPAVYRKFENVDPNTLSCDPDGLWFLLLPHFFDCNKFYMCVFGEEIEFDCPLGLLFDFGLQTCNWSWGTQCTLRRPKEEEEEGSGDNSIGINIEFGKSSGKPGKSSSSSESSESSSSESDESSGDSDLTSEWNSHPKFPRRYHGIINCHRADEAARRVAHKGDCQKYWRCIDGVPQVAYCSDGLFFNKQTQQCDYEANSKCIVQQEDELQSEFIKYNK